MRKWKTHRADVQIARIYMYSQANAHIHTVHVYGFAAVVTIDLAKEVRNLSLLQASALQDLVSVLGFPLCTHLATLVRGEM